MKAAERKVSDEERNNIDTLYINFKVTKRYVEYHRCKYTNRPVDEEGYFSVPIGLSFDEVPGYGYWFLMNPAVAKSVSLARKVVPMNEMIGMPYYKLPVEYNGKGEKWPCALNSGNATAIKPPFSFHDFSKRNLGAQLKPGAKYWDYFDDANTFIKSFYNGGNKVETSQEEGFPLSGFAQSIMIRSDYFGTMMDNCHLTVKEGGDGMTVDGNVVFDETARTLDITDSVYVPNAFELQRIIDYNDVMDGFSWEGEAWTSTLFDEKNAYTMTKSGEINIRPMNSTATGVYMMFFPTAVMMRDYMQFIGHNVTSMSQAEKYAETAYDLLSKAADDRNRDIALMGEIDEF